MRKLFFGSGIISLILCIITLACWVEGAILSFHAALWMGIVALFLEPAYFVFGLVHFIGGPNLAHVIVHACR